MAEQPGRPQLEEALLAGWGAVLKPMAARGKLAFGPPDGRSVTFVAPRAAVRELGDELVERDVEGHRGGTTVAGAAAVAGAAPSRVVRLLPGFDP